MQRGRGQNLEIGHRQRPLADRGADAIGAGVAAANDDDVLAASEDRVGVICGFAAQPSILLRQEIHGEMDAFQLAAGNGQVARLLSAAGEHDRIMVFKEFCSRQIRADMGVVMEHHAFRLHLRDASVDVILFHLKVGNAVAQQAAGFGVFLVDVNGVTGARELLCASQSRRSGADNCNGLAGLC